MPSQPESGMQIAGTGIYLPSRIVTNHELEKLVETTDEWILTRTGIKERRISSESETSTFMGVAAAKQALAQAKLAPSDLDLILVATVTPDSFSPPPPAESRRNSGPLVAPLLICRPHALVSFTG